MIKAIKKLFDWTPSDIAAWEKMRQPGAWHFVAWYGLIGFGSFLLLVTGAITLFNWFRQPGTPASLFLQLAADVLIFLAGGLITGLSTWWLEDGIYKRIIKSGQKGG